MRVFDGQVHVAEVALWIALTVLCIGLGFSWPVALLALLIGWPMLVIQLLMQWGLDRLWQTWRRPRPKRPRRVGIARYLWALPLMGLTLGYLMYVADSGTWLL